MGVTIVECPDCPCTFLSYYGGVTASQRWAEHYALVHGTAEEDAEVQS